MPEIKFMEKKYKTDFKPTAEKVLNFMIIQVKNSIIVSLLVEKFDM